MRAWLMDGFDGVDRLRLGEVPDPRPGPGEVLLRVQFAALNPADAFLAEALYPAKPALPHVLGRDGVGDVLAVDPGVSDWRVGEIAGVLRGGTGVERWGTLAEQVVVPAQNLAPLPAGWSLEEMAGAPLVFLTAWQALTQWSDPPAAPRAGSVVLVTGASGGVGLATVMLAKSMDLVVIGLSRSREKAVRLKELGADFAFEVGDPNLRKSVASAIAPNRVDLVVDSVGGPLFNTLVPLLGYGGRISVVGRSAGTVPDFNTATLLFRRNRLGGVAVADVTPAEARATWGRIVEALTATDRRPVVDRVFAFEDVQAAFARLREGPMGKVVVRVAG
jgi:NADPH2:quinone reductase